MRELGRLYVDGTAVPRDTNEALKWFVRAAQMGDDDSIEDLAALISSQEVPPEALDNVIAEIENSSSAGAAGTASLAMAKFYTEIAKTDSRYLFRANQMLRDAADSGNGDAMMLLSDRYALGVGVERSPEESTRWLKVAAEHGYMQAYSRYAVALQLGLGVKADPDQARYWLERAGAPASPVAP